MNIIVVGMFLKQYFEHTGDKTYIDKYPKEIIDISRLNNSVLVELGGGVGNDMCFLITKLKFDPNNLFFIEKNPEIFNLAEKKLNKFLNNSSHLLREDALKSSLPSGFADYVYANNLLHCLESKENIEKLFEEVKRILKNGGTFFGRTLSNRIDEKILSRFLNTKKINKNQKFFLETVLTMKDGTLIGLSEKDIKYFAQIVGFKGLEIRFVSNQEDRPTKDFYFRMIK